MLSGKTVRKYGKLPMTAFSAVTHNRSKPSTEKEKLIQLLNITYNVILILRKNNPSVKNADLSSRTALEGDSQHNCLQGYSARF